MRRIALGLEYEGTRYLGWQRQPQGGTVQDAVEAALGGIAGHAVQAHAAGRTDAGVHALGQVLHFDTPADRPLTAWVRGTNALLPGDISVRWAVPVAADFHARHAARGRSYLYLLLNRPQRPGVGRGRIGWHHRPLDVARMRTAATHLLGRQDFSSFRAAECQARSPVKEMRAVRIERAGDLVMFRFCADAFLHHMVRNLVGSLVRVGHGAASPDWIAELIAGRDRRLAAPTFAPDGLYLETVEYDAAAALPAPRPALPADLILGLCLAPGAGGA